MKQNSNWPTNLPALLIQQIRLQWYKDCRGGNAAAQRNHYRTAKSELKVDADALEVSYNGPEDWYYPLEK